MQIQFPALVLRPALFVIAGILILFLKPSQAQFTPIEVQQAPTLTVLVAQLGAQAAQPSSHLQLKLPDLALPGPVQASAYSELPGTTTLVLVRGLHIAASPTTKANLSPPPQFARTSSGELAAAPPPAVWIASASFKAGQSPRLQANFDVSKTADYTLFAHAQGRWWFVSRQIKVGSAPEGLTGKARSGR